MEIFLNRKGFMSKLNDKQIELMRSQKDIIVKYFTTHKLDKVSIYSATTFIPLVAIYTFLLEDFPEHKELCEKKLKELEEFYG
jgi:hypothetical protein